MSVRRVSPILRHTPILLLARFLRHTPLPRLAPLLALLASALLGEGVAAQDSATTTAGLGPFAEQRAERLLEQRVACRGCHVIAGRGGRIGPVLDGVGDRVDAAYVRAMIADPAATVPGTSMPAQWMPPGELDRLVAYLLGRPTAPPPADGVTPRAPAALSDPTTTDGAALYARHCAACHGEDGRGDGWNAAALPVAPTAHADAELMRARTDDSLYDAIHSGAYVLDGSPRMPPFGALLSDAQIRGLVAWIRALCSCSQPTWAGAS